MHLAYFDCFSGISGDMTLGALIACGVDPDDLRAELDKLNLSGWELEVQTVSRNGIGAVDVTVRVTEQQGHGRHLHNIKEILAGSDLSGSVKIKATAVFRRLAEAEAAIHQTTIEKIHFHEVGAIDAIVDIVGACICLEKLRIEAIHCSPLPMGRGFVECAHGTIPLPAPAVLELTHGKPVYGVDVEGELVTPTGAAIVTALADHFGAVPPMTLKSSGYGAGKKSFGDRPNLLRVMVGEVIEDEFLAAPEVAIIETNIDDLSPQFYEPVTEKLFEAGALDVYLTPVQMKKGRPGTLITVLCPPEKDEAMAEILFKETSTLGVRFSTMKRICLHREWVKVETEYGPIRMKTGERNGHILTAAPEYEDILSAAREHDAPVKAVHLAAVTAYKSRSG